MSNHGSAYWEARSHYEEMTGLDYEKRHRRKRLTCPCDRCLVDRGPMADRKNWAGYTLRELGYVTDVA